MAGKTFTAVGEFLKYMEGWLRGRVVACIVLCRGRANRELLSAARTSWCRGRGAMMLFLGVFDLGMGFYASRIMGMSGMMILMVQKELFMVIECRVFSFDTWCFCD